MGENGAPITSFNLNDKITFQVPPNSKSDEDIDIFFIIANDVQTFTAKRKITALKNQAFDIQKSAASEKIAAGTSSANDLASVASMMVAVANNKGSSDNNSQSKLDNPDGPCSDTETTPCSGNGACVAGFVQKFMCKCNSAFAGKLCTVPAEEQAKLDKVASQVMAACLQLPVSVENVDALVSSFSNAASSTALDPTTSKGALNKLKEIGSLVKDSNTLNNVLGAISSTTKSTSSASKRRDLAASDTDAIKLT